MLHLKTSTLLSEFLLLGWCLSNPLRDEVQQNTILRTAAINACAKGDGQWRMDEGKKCCWKKWHRVGKAHFKISEHFSYH